MKDKEIQGNFDLNLVYPFPSYYLRISQRRFLLVDDLREDVDLEVEVDECEHKEADEADLHLNKLKWQQEMC